MDKGSAGSHTPPQKQGPTVPSGLCGAQDNRNRLNDDDVKCGGGANKDRVTEQGADDDDWVLK